FRLTPLTHGGLSANFQDGKNFSETSVRCFLQGLFIHDLIFPQIPKFLQGLTGDSVEGLLAQVDQLACHSLRCRKQLMEPSLRKLSVWIYCRGMETRGPKSTQADTMSACVDWHM
ncbi:hypothetical protein DJ030_00175, partial [bacterium endosymbiont of Escarpia laminata]